MPIKEKIGTTVPDPELDDLRSVEVDHPIREPYMPPANERRVVANVIRRFRHYSDIRQPWHEAAVEDLGFYMLKQWKDWEKVELDARGQAPLVPDEIRAAIRNFVAQLTANMPEFRVTGVTDDDVRKAEMFNGIIQFILYNNDFLDKLQEWVKDHGVVGLGAFLVQWNPHGLDGKGRIETVLLSPFEVYADPESREKDWSDAERIIVSRWIGKNRALLLIPERAAEIRRLLPDSDDDRQFIEQQFHSEEDVKLLDEVLDEDKDHLRYIEEYTRFSQPFFEGVDRLLAKVTPELDEKTYKAWKEDTAIADGIESGAITVEKTWKIRMRRRVVIGNMLIGEEILPTSHYPVIPLFFEHQRNPYSMGAVRGMKMMQRERNKRRSLMIAYATAATNNKLLIDENAIVDKENIETQWGRPNAVIPIKTISDRPLKDHFWTPTVAPLPSALFTLEQESKQDMADYIGIDRLSRGVSGAAPSTLGATLSIDEFGQRGQIPYVRNIGYALRRMGKVLIDFIQFYMTKPDFIRILNPDRQPAEQAEGFAVNIPQYDTFTEEEIEKIKAQFPKKIAKEI